MITDSLQKLKQIKTDIKDAIIRKGGDANDDFTTYAESVANIPVGEFIIPEGMRFSRSSIERFPKDFVWSDSANWTDFSEMFSYCKNLKEIPNLDVSSGTDFNHMFAYSGDGTIELDLSQWKNQNDALMEYLVQYANFKDIKLPKE